MRCDRQTEKYDILQGRTFANFVKECAKNNLFGREYFNTDFLNKRNEISEIIDE